MAVTLALLDAGAILAALWSTMLLWAAGLPLASLGVATLAGQGAVICACCLIAFYYGGFYDFRIARDFFSFASRLPVALASTLILLAIFYTVFPETRLEAGLSVAALVVTAAFLLLLRAGFYKLIRSRLLMKRVLILGTGPLARRLMEEIEAQPGCGYAIVGVIGDGKAATDRSLPYPVLGHVHWLAKIIEEVRPDGIIAALTEKTHLPTRQLLECRLKGIIVEDGVEVYERLAEKLAIEWHTPASLIFSKDFRKSRVELAVGRAVSLVASILGLILFAPLFALIALAIKLDSSGPVLFVQERVGLHGRPFKLLKFRTMRAASRRTSEWVRDNGDRITRVGKWLRKFRLDELPQFVNILRGDMNLVGPRPHPLSNFELFVLVLRNAPESGEEIPYYSLRCVVRPGITGWAQVRYGYANDLHEEIEKMRYDLYYIKHLSLWFDLRILLDTIKTVVFGLGSQATDAYRGGREAGPSYGEVHHAA